MNGYFAALADVYWDDPDNFNHMRVIRVRATTHRPAVLPSQDRTGLLCSDGPCGTAPGGLSQRFLQDPRLMPLPNAPVGHRMAGRHGTLDVPGAEFYPGPPGYPGATAEPAPDRSHPGTARAQFRTPATGGGLAPGEAMATAPRPAAKGQAARPFGLVYRKLFPEPGLYFRVPFGGFARELSIHLASPQVLAPSQGIDCLLQIYQIHRPIPKARIAHIETGDEANQHQFHLLTPQKERMLGLDQIPAIFPGHRGLQPQAAVPTRLFRLIPVSDPSLEDRHAPEQGTTAAPLREAVPGEGPFGHAMDDFQPTNDYGGDDHA